MMGVFAQAWENSVGGTLPNEGCVRQSKNWGDALSTVN
jgi:hypothetical protein